jgi:hypothetical protein
MEHFNTGLPCMHEFSIGLRRRKKLLFSERWFKDYEDFASKNSELVSQVVNLNKSE